MLWLEVSLPLRLRFISHCSRSAIGNPACHLQISVSVSKNKQLWVTLGIETKLGHTRHIITSQGHTKQATMGILHPDGIYWRSDGVSAKKDLSMLAVVGGLHGHPNFHTPSMSGVWQNLVNLRPRFGQTMTAEQHACSWG